MTKHHPVIEKLLEIHMFQAGGDAVLIATPKGCGAFSFEISNGCTWERKDIKELRAYLKAILRDTKA